MSKNEWEWVLAWTSRDKHERAREGSAGRMDGYRGVQMSTGGGANERKQVTVGATATGAAGNGGNSGGGDSRNGSTNNGANTTSGSRAAVMVGMAVGGQWEWQRGSNGNGGSVSISGYGSSTCSSSSRAAGVGALHSSLPSPCFFVLFLFYYFLIIFICKYKFLIQRNHGFCRAPCQ